MGFGDSRPGQDGRPQDGEVGAASHGRKELGRRVLLAQIRDKFDGWLLMVEEIYGLCEVHLVQNFIDIQAIEILQITSMDAGNVTRRLTNQSNSFLPPWSPVLRWWKSWNSCIMHTSGTISHDSVADTMFA